MRVTKAVAKMRLMPKVVLLVKVITVVAKGHLDFKRWEENKQTNYNIKKIYIYNSFSALFIPLLLRQP